MAWYDTAVFYHIYPLGLCGCAHENDGRPTPGAFAKLNAWAEHASKDLGCTAIYIGPLFESGSHGYDTIDYRRVDRRLGTNEEFREFVANCHARGQKVIVDGVFNHVGRDFFAFKDLQANRENSRYKDWFCDVNFWGNNEYNDGFSYGNWGGFNLLVKLNQRNPEVQNYHFDTIRFWVDEFDIDGIRLDCANILDFNFMKEMRAKTASMKPDFWLMGEVIHGDYSRWVNPEMLHSVTNYELHKSIYSGFNDHNFFEIAHNVRRLEAIGRQLYTFLDNHDEDRIASKLKVKEHLYPVYTCLMTLPGIPSIYYGGEWGTEGKRTSTCDDDLRPCIPAEKIPELNCELTDFISRLGKIHEENEELHTGKYQELLLTNRQYAYARWGNNSLIITALNNDDNEATLNIPVPIQAQTAVDLLNSDNETCENNVLPVQNGRLEIKLKGNWGAVLKIKGEN